MDESSLLQSVNACASRGERPALGIMGGTFDPVHVGHLSLAKAAFDELSLQGVLFIPTGNPSFKLGKTVTAGQERLEMLGLALDGMPWAALSRMEIDRPGVTYTVDTLRDLSKRLDDNVRLVFIAGADSLDTLPLWHESHEVLDLCEVAAAGREGSPFEEAKEALEAFHPTCTVHLLRTSVPNVSSTLLRERVRKGESVADFVPPRVLAYVREHGLYVQDENGVG